MPPGPRAGGPPIQLFAYDSGFQPSDPHAPSLPQDLAAKLTANAATFTFPADDGRGVAMVLRTPWPDGPCAIFMARLPPRPGEFHDLLLELALVVVTVVAAVWFAGGPVLARMRRLRDAVGRSADTRYETPVPVDGGGELADLARAFNDAGARIRRHIGDVETRERSLREFVANTTHDVAMPLTVLQGHLAELERRATPGSEDQTAVAAAVREAHYLSSLVRNLGAATRLDARDGAIDRRPVDMNALVERVVLRHQPVARASGVILDFAVPERALTLSTDITLLEQAVGNLVDNAVRYNRNGGHVAVVLDTPSAAAFTVTVSDDGPGVAPEDLERITERRFRSEAARTRRPDGQGIGLAIVSEVATRLGYELAFRQNAPNGLISLISGPVQ
jgi:signal transduction histidine kinase